MGSDVFAHPVELAELCLASGAGELVNQVRSYNNKTALGILADSNTGNHQLERQLAKLLLSHGADPTTVTNALGAAAYAGNNQIVRLLLTRMQIPMQGYTTPVTCVGSPSRNS